MACSKTKTKFIAQLSLQQFFLEHHRGCYFWTFTFAAEPSPLFLSSDSDGYNPTDKTWCEERFKPFKDLMVREDADFLYCWEIQGNGRWHIHCLTDKRFDVCWLRPWMMARGWGQQMRVEFFKPELFRNEGYGWAPVADGRCERLTRYITKYLTKSIDSTGVMHKKCFGGRARSKRGTTAFKWLPEVKPGSYLWYYGRSLFWDIWGRVPTFQEMSLVMRLGVEDTDWLSVDPWYFETAPG
jgi:hypothetical protein